MRKVSAPKSHSLVPSSSSFSFSFAKRFYLFLFIEFVPICCGTFEGRNPENGLPIMTVIGTSSDDLKSEDLQSLNEPDLERFRLRKEKKIFYVALDQISQLTPNPSEIRIWHRILPGLLYDLAFLQD